MMRTVESNWTLIPSFSISNLTSTATKCKCCKKKTNMSSLRKYQTPTICSSTPTTMIKLPITGIPLIPRYTFQSVATQSVWNQAWKLNEYSDSGTTCFLWKVSFTIWSYRTIWNYRRISNEVYEIAMSICVLPLWLKMLQNYATLLSNT